MKIRITGTPQECADAVRVLRLGFDEDRDELEWRPADDAAEPAVLFTAEAVPGG